MGFPTTNPIGVTSSVLNHLSELMTPAVSSAEILKSNPSANAEAIAIVVGGEVKEIQIIRGGSGYLVAPTITFVGGGNDNSGDLSATATATITNGVVTAITVTDGGAGYDVSPQVVMTDSPQSSALAGTGALKLFTGGLSRLPISPGSVSIKDSGSVETFTDAGGLGILTSTLGGSGTINYLTGEFTVTFITAPANATTIRGTYTYGKFSQFKVDRNSSVFGGPNLVVTFVDNYSSLPYQFEASLQRRDTASGVRG